MTAYPCCRHCDHDPGFMHTDPCQSLIYDGEHCQSGPAGAPIGPMWIAALGVRKLIDEQLDRQEWTDRLALGWGLIRVPESLTVAQLDAQTDMRDRKLGLKFYPTTPMPGFMIRTGDQGAEIIWDPPEGEL